MCNLAGVVMSVHPLILLPLLQGQQWVRMVVVGQSFMLHQIRKLVGTAVAVMRGTAPPDAIALALDPAKVVVTPMAPELGLFLDECVFESYNDRWGSHREACVRLAAFQDQVDAFKVRLQHGWKTLYDLWVLSWVLHRFAEESLHCSEPLGEKKPVFWSRAQLVAYSLTTLNRSAKELEPASHLCVAMEVMTGFVCGVQRARIYPHIASYDAENGTNAAWLSCLTEGNFRFSEWHTSALVQPVQARFHLHSHACKHTTARTIVTLACSENGTLCLSGLILCCRKSAVRQRAPLVHSACAPICDFAVREVQVQNTTAESEAPWCL